MQNYYTLIGLAPTASIDEIKAAISAKRKAEAKGTNSSKLEKRQEAERIMQLLHDAYSILLDPQKRVKYDQELKSAPREEREIDESDLKEKEDLVALGWQLLIKGEVADALYVATKATEQDASNADAWALLGQAKYRWGETEDAIYEYKRAIKLRPNDPEFYYDLGNVYESADRPNEAYTQYQRAVTINHQVASYRAAIGALLVKKGQYEDGIRILEQCVQEEPDNQSYKWFLAPALIDSAFELWTFVPEDRRLTLLRHRRGYCATTREQVLAAQARVAKAEALNINDEDAKRHIANAKAAIDVQLKRAFYGSIFVPILGGIIWWFIIDAYIPGGGFLALPLVAAYFGASRPPIYRLNKRLLEGSETLDSMWEGGPLAVLAGSAIFGLLLPIMTVWNGVKNHT